MATYDKENIVAAAKEAGLFIGSDDNPAVALWWYPEVERFYAVAFEAGAASRDAEVERYAYVVQQVRKALCGDIHNTEDLLFLITSLQSERDQLREQVKMLRDALNRIRTDDQQHMLIKHKALAATAPKP